MLPAPPARSAPAAVPTTVPAATDDLAERARALARPAIDDGRLAGMVIGVVDKKGATRLFGFGRISRADPRPPDRKTVFEIGSVSKVFTSTLLADLVERKVVALDDPIKKYLPPGVKGPVARRSRDHLGPSGHAQLGPAAHAGQLRAKGLEEPVRRRGRPALRISVVMHARARPRRPLRILQPGRWLAGHILTLVSKQTYDALLAARLTGPLGMKSTRVVMDAGQRGALAEGHDEGARWRRHGI
jgi:D-alanyl-D-alanine-carboxypeptidase/D-alanyl-D-alanine-endopeptidase